MKFKKILQIGVILIAGSVILSSCEKSETKNTVKEDCENKVPREGYMYQWNEGTQTCEEIQLPVQKKDTILKWNLKNSNSYFDSGIGFPTSFQLDSIKKLPETKNIILELYAEDQRGTSQILVDRSADSLKIWVVNGLVTIKKGDTLLVSDEPTEEITKKYKDLGLFIKQWQDKSKSVGGKGGKGYNSEARFGGSDGKTFVSSNRDIDIMSGMTSKQFSAKSQALWAARKTERRKYFNTVNDGKAYNG